MKRIIAVSTLAVATLVGFSSAASAQTAESTHTGTVLATCSVTSNMPQTFSQNTTLINGVAFPTLLTSAGKFTTLCNTVSSNITVAQQQAPTFPNNQKAPTVTYDLSGSNTVYPSSGFLATAIPIGTSTTGIAVHAFSNSSTDLNVGVKVAAAANTILQSGDYSVILKATLTP